MGLANIVQNLRHQLGLEMPSLFRDASQTENRVGFVSVLQQTNGPIAGGSMIATRPLSVFEKLKRRIHASPRYLAAAALLADFLNNMSK
jgi:hypothetical protein